MEITAETRGADLPEQERNRWIAGFLAGAAVLVGLRARVDFLVDDAFISFRYARSWWENGIPVFNAFELADGSQPVEGFSNALWTGLLALAHGAGFDLVVKCLRVRVPIIVSVSAPSAMAFDLCEAAGATLVGFARGDRRTVYCGADRLV